MSKRINAVFGSGVFSKTLNVFQWDSDDRLVFAGINLPETYEVHFANSLTGEAKKAFGTSEGVKIPPEYFIPGTEIYAWLWVVTNDGGYTKYQVKIPVHKRAQPSNITPTPAQQDALDQAIAAINEATESVPSQINAALLAAKESGEFDGHPGVVVPAGGSTGQVLAKRSGTDFTVSAPTRWSGSWLRCLLLSQRTKKLPQRTTRPH